jgi:integrase
MGRFSLVEYLDDAYSPWANKGEIWHMPNDEYVVSIIPLGEDVLFSHDTWYFFNRGLAPNKPNYFKISYEKESLDECALRNLKESKSILLALDRHAFVKPGQPLGLATLNRYNLALQHVRRACKKNHESVFDVLSNSTRLGEAYELYSSNAPASSRTLIDLMKKLSLLPFRYVGFKPALLPFSMRPSPSSEAGKEFHQTEIIPTQIYLDLLVSYKEVAKDYLAVKDELRELAKCISKDPSYGRSKTKDGGKFFSFEQAVAAVGLEWYAKKYNVSSVVELQRNFGTVHYACIMLIHAFTGMRKSEAYSLRLTSLKKKVEGVRVVAYGLYGFTTKFRGKRKRVIWYTSVDVELPFEAASHVCETIMFCNGEHVPNQYLFISTGYFPFSSSSDSLRPLGSSNPTCGNYEPSKYQMHLGTPAITGEHLDELRALNPFRVWEGEEVFQLGKEWPLKIHQLRRSTAVYAMASGLVSLPALKEMLKHLTLAMSRYYAKGSVYAHNILKYHKSDKDSWPVRYQESEIFVRAFQYVQELIIPDEVLLGPAGVWLERNSKPQLKSLAYAESLENTMRKMKKGQIYYRPTPVGGCTFNGICNKRASVSFIGCEGCSYAAVKESKLLKLISVQEVFVQRLENTPEYQFECNTLSELKEFSARLGVKL